MSQYGTILEEDVSTEDRVASMNMTLDSFIQGLSQKVRNLDQPLLRKNSSASVHKT